MTEQPLDPNLAEFIAQFSHAFCEGQLQRLVLSRYQGPQAGLLRVQLRPILLKSGTQLSLLFKNQTFDQTKNLSLAEVQNELQGWLPEQFKAALLEFNGGEWQLTVSKKGKALLSKRKVAAVATSADVAHNREKHRHLPQTAPFLQALGITDKQAQVVPAMQKKWKQINKFIEVFGNAMHNAKFAEGQAIRVADFGSGKAYLTFAVHHYLQQQQWPTEVIGVELRQSLVDLCNTTAAQLNLAGIRFEQGDVQHYQSTGLEVMIALHACDVATDYAIHMGIQAGAKVIMCSPCCHKEIRPQLRSPTVLQPLLQHGIHLGQEAEMLTDGLRALLLEAAGYDTQVFEFISLEHTSKNKMILAVKRQQHKPNDAVLAQIAALKQFYGIEKQTLEALLNQQQVATSDCGC